MKGKGAVIRPAHFMAVVVRASLLGCAVLLLMVGCAGTRSETSNKKEQGSSPQATESEEEARCEGTQTFQKWRNTWTTNDLPGCPKGGLLSGTDEPDKLGGRAGDDEIRGLGAKDQVLGGLGSDVIYGGLGDDSLLVGGDGDDVIYGGDGDDGIGAGTGADVIYGGDGNDFLENDGGDASLTGADGHRDKLYCGKGKDVYSADKKDFVSSSCEKKWRSPIVG